MKSLRVIDIFGLLFPTMIAAAPKRDGWQLRHFKPTMGPGTGPGSGGGHQRTRDQRYPRFYVPGDA